MAWLLTALGALLGIASVAGMAFTDSVSRTLIPDELPELNLATLREVAPGYFAATLLCAALLTTVGVALSRAARKVPPLAKTAQLRLVAATVAVCSTIVLAQSLRARELLFVHSDLVAWFYALPAAIALAATGLAATPRLVQVNFAVLLAILAIVELTFLVVPFRHEPEVVKERRVAGGGSPVRMSSVTGFIPRAGRTIWAKKLVDGELLYSVKYHIDQYSRRVVPNTESERDKYLLFFGGSRTFGLGCNDDETMPYFVGQAMADHKPYIYAYPAWGPAQFLALLRDRDLAKEIPQKQGTVAFLMIPGHVRRTVGTFRISTHYNGGYLPLFERDSHGRIVRRGMFVSDRPIRQLFFAGLSLSPTFNFFVRDLPVSKADDAFTADVIAAIRDELRQELSPTRFVVFYHPGHSALDALSPLLEERNVEHVSLADLFELDDKRFIHSQHDNHLNAAGNRRVAAAIAAHLRE